MAKTFLFVLIIFVSNSLSAQNFNVSEAEALSTAKTIEASSKNHDASVLGNFFDLPSFTTRIKERSVWASKSAQMFEGFKSTFNMQYFAAQMIDFVKDGSYELLRSYESGNKRHLLFRSFGNKGINYHDYVLIKVNAEIKAADAYIYLTGEDLSTTVADMIDASLGTKDHIDQIPENLRLLLLMKEYKKSNDNNAIIKLYDSLDDNNKKNKAMQILYISACQAVDVRSERYKNALETYNNTFPDASNAALMMIDYYFLNKDYDGALTAVNKLDSLVKKDPFLDFFRANIFLMEGDKEKARTSYYTVFQQYPTASYIIKNLVILDMQSGETAAAKSALNTYKKSDGIKQQYIDDLYLMYPELKE